MTLRVIATVFFFASAVRLNAQQDSLLDKRLAAVLTYTQQSDLDKVLDYTYPKLFTLVTREQMRGALQNAFNTEEFLVSIDSIKLLKRFPVFTVAEEDFSKIRHSLLMRMKFKERADTTNADVIKEREDLSNLMEGKFGSGNVQYDKKGDALLIYTVSYMVAIRSNVDKQWYFVNLDEDNPAILNFLFGKPVIEKLATYK